MSFAFVAGVTPRLLEAVSELPEGTILHFDKELLVETGILWLNIMVLVAVLAFLMYKPVKKFMNARTQRVQERIDKTEEDAGAAQALREKYEALIADIEEERDEILRQGRETALERSEEIIADARREAANIYRRSMEDLRLEQENSMDEMRRAIIELSTLLAGRFVTVSIDQETQDQYVDEALGHLEDMLWES